MRPLHVLAIAVALLVASPAVACPGRQPEPKPCTSHVHEGARYTVCTVQPDKATIRLALHRPDGEPYGTLSALPKLDASHQEAALVRDQRGHVPCRSASRSAFMSKGGRQIKAASTSNGPGNFHLKPNGIFYLAGGRAGVLETGAFCGQAEGRHRHAIGADARHRRQVASKIRQRRGQPQDAQRRRRDCGGHSRVRDHRGPRLVRRVRPAVPRRARLPQRPVPRRRQRADALCTRAWPRQQLPARWGPCWPSTASEQNRDGGLRSLNTGTVAIVTLHPPPLARNLRP